MGRARTLLVMGFMLVLFLSLGAWQLRRAEERAASYEQFSAAGGRPALRGPADGERFEEHRYRWVELRGRYVSSRQFLLDSMTHQGRAGYHVLTPFHAPDHESWVLVNRGWVAADPDRGRLPPVHVGEAARVVRARIDALPRPGLKLKDSAEPTDHWPQVVFFPTFGELEERLGHALLPYQLLLSAEAADGFVREWRPRAMTPERHIGYAVQWFSFAGVLAAAGVILGLRSMRR